MKDLRYGLRILARNPGFTTVAVLTLALGIGANTAIFSVVYAALLRPLPYFQPDRLITLAESRSQTDFESTNASYPDYLDWVRQAHSFDSLAAYASRGYTLTGVGAPELVPATHVTSNFFSTLGVRPAPGRDFAPGEDRAKGPKIVIVSNPFWRGHLAANPNVVGQTLRLDGESYTIIGVLPSGYEFAPTNNTPLWVPLAPSEDLASRRNLRWMNVIGRLKKGTTFDQARVEMETITARLSVAYPQENGALRIHLGLLRKRIVGPVRPLLLTLFGAVSFVLLIACANVANLLLARSASRRREVAVRVALGAGRRALVRQFLTESILLALLGGALGLLLSGWGVQLLVAAVPADQLRAMPYLNSVRSDPGVLAFVFAVTLATGILAGLAPALQLSSADVNEALKDEARSSAGLGAAWVRSGLVIAEIGFSLVLLIGAGLMVKSLAALLDQSPGFQSQNVLTFAVDLPSAAYPDDPSAFRFEQRLSERIQNLPGVQGIATVSKLPVTGIGNTIRFVVEGRPTASGQEDETNIRTVSANYFQVMKIPLEKGRFFGPTDQVNAPLRLVVNRAFANRYFPGEDPVGKRIRFTFRADQPYREVIGVVGDENVDQLDAPMPSILYTCFEQEPDSFFNAVVRTTGSPAAMIPPIRDALRSVDAELPLIMPRTMEQLISDSQSVFLRRYPSYLIGSFAALAVVLAMIGLYGVISFAISQRTREIGIRMVLGAQSRDIWRLVIGGGMRLAVLGVALGLGASLAVTRFLASLLFGVSAVDPATFATTAVLLTLVALLACYIPARRAMRADPTEALRYE